MARYGGDEFTVLCEDLRDADEATTILDRICQAAISTAEGDELIGLSIGIAMIDDPGVGAMAIISLPTLPCIRPSGPGTAPVGPDDDQLGRVARCPDIRAAGPIPLPSASSS